MGYKLRDIECQSCQHVWEDLIGDGEVLACPECGSEDVKNLIPLVRANTMNLMSKDEYRKSMMKRSQEHTLRSLKKDGIPKQNKNNLDSLKVDK